MPGTEISIPREVLAEPTVCGPVSDFKELTLASNAITLGWMGFAAGITFSVLFFLGIYYAGPYVYIQGKTRGWWS